MALSHTGHGIFPLLNPAAVEANTPESHGCCTEGDWVCWGLPEAAAEGHREVHAPGCLPHLSLMAGGAPKYHNRVHISWAATSGFVFPCSGWETGATIGMPLLPEVCLQTLPLEMAPKVLPHRSPW